MATEKVLEVPPLIKDATSRQYFPDSQLGAGGFATCWRARMVDRRRVPEADLCALKAVKSAVPKNLVSRFRLELAIQSKLDHPHIVKLYRAFTFKDVTYVALELCPNGSLTDMMRRRKFLTMGEIRRILFQLCGAVKYLHDRDVVHRDIKAGNIFMDENMNIKLGDFGLAAIMEPASNTAEVQHLRRTTFCGTPNYLAPEILSRKEGHGTSVDIWAIGILAFYLAVGRAPFHSKSKDEIYAKLKKGEYSWPELSPEENEIPQDLRDLVGMILVEESRRPKTEDIIKHPFFTDGFIPDILDPLCRTRRPKFARLNDDRNCSGRCVSSSQCTCDAVRKHHTQQRIYHNLSRESRIGDAHNAVPSVRPPKSVFLILAHEISKKKKLEIPLAEGLVYTGRSEKSSDSKVAAMVPKAFRRRKSQADQVTPDAAAVSENKENQVVDLDRLAETRAKLVTSAMTSSTPAADMAAEEESKSLGTMRARPRKPPAPKFEIREDDVVEPMRVVVVEQSERSSRLRPLRSRIERGNRVREGIEAFEKRTRVVA